MGPATDTLPKSLLRGETCSWEYSEPEPAGSVQVALDVETRATSWLVWGLSSRNTGHSTSSSVSLLIRCGITEHSNPAAPQCSSSSSVLQWPLGNGAREESQNTQLEEGDTRVLTREDLLWIIWSGPEVAFWREDSVFVFCLRGYGKNQPSLSDFSKTCWVRLSTTFQG